MVVHIKKILYYLNRSRELGFFQSCTRIHYRMAKKHFAWRWKSKAFANKANHLWEQIEKKHSFDFPTFLSECRKNDFVPINLDSKKIPPLYSCPQSIIVNANKACKNCFQVLSSRQHCFTNKIPWKSDFNNPNSNDFPNLFYQEMQPSKKKINPQVLLPDIKVPWELSRFQHVYILGKAYQLTNDKKYALAFKSQISNWLLQNRFLIGVNWACPMDVAIRAINWIYGFSFFKNSSDIPPSFWKTFLCSLYDHAFYLENNWETSDKPNNHYISDLIGYFYLATFFNKITYFKKKQEKTYQLILEQAKKQVLPDGTTYEGSTAYHKLVTELFWHFSLVCKEKKIILPKWFSHKLSLMFTFLKDTYIQIKSPTSHHMLLQIGDNDSGKIVTGLTPQTQPEQKRTTHYPNFGLTIIKNQHVHISFRHPTYHPTQPTGHFHHDELAITYTYKNIPILVDPGSYLYTANDAWRNEMRSTNNHNTFYPKNKTFLGPELFQLNKKTQPDTAIINKRETEIEIINTYNMQTRKLTYNKSENTIKIEDNIPPKNQYEWILLFHPYIELEQTNNYFIILYQHKKLITLKSNLKYEIKNGCYSPAYGQIKPCKKLVGKHTGIRIGLTELSPV